MIRILADPQREQIVSLLSQGPACTCHLVADTGLKQPTVSHHLRVLKEAGVVDSEPAGRFTYYRLVPAVLDGAAEHFAGLADSARRNADAAREC